jgi:6-phosphogluconolactonase
VDECKPLVDGEFVVEAFDNEEELAKALCLEVEENAKACIEERGYFTFAIPGGSVAKALTAGHHKGVIRVL